MNSVVCCLAYDESIVYTHAFFPTIDYIICMRDIALIDIPNPNEDDAYGEAIHNEPSPNPDEDETLTIDHAMDIGLNL